MAMLTETVSSAQAAGDTKKDRIKSRPAGVGQHRTELLAPAGNYECFLAAVHAGADAVYLAGKQFGARAAADNFSEDELTAAIRYAHLFGRKVYMTVNTLLKDEELDGLCRYLFPYVEAGLDAVIIQDFGVLSVIKKEFPHLAIHCSTQMTITDEWGVRLAKELGASRVVPARELSLAEIRQMKQVCPEMELECFVHGAMCYCYSGQCLMSSLIGGRSGSRGTCAQPCRLPYTVEQAGRHTDAYPLSMKDLCAIRLVPELIRAGIDSFKIEGRMKSAEYCAGVTAVYRAVMDRFFADGETAQGVTEEELSLLRGLYVRSEIGEGYYHCRSGAHMLTQGKPGYRGCDDSVLAMLRTRYLEQRPTIPVTMTVSLHAGKAARLTVSCDDVAKNAYPTVSSDNVVKDAYPTASSDNVVKDAYPTVSCDSEYAEALRVHQDEAVGVTCTGGLVQAAANKPLSGEEIEKRLCKTGGTPFAVTKIQIAMTEDVFLPVGQLNELRREALARMEEALLARYAKEREEQTQRVAPTQQAEQTERTASAQQTAQTVQMVQMVQPPALQQPNNARGYLAVVDTAQQLAVCAAHPLLAGICVPVQLYETCWRENGAAFSKSFYLYLPRILRQKDTERISGTIRALAADGAPIDGMYVHTAGEYRFAVSVAEALGKNPCEWIFGSPFFYCMNAESVRFWRARVGGVSVPYELCEREIRALLERAKQAGASGMEMPVYGHIPMMVTANCIVQSFNKKNCPHPDAPVFIKDRTGQRMDVKTECGVCLNTIYNSVPLSMHKHMQKLQKLYENGMLGAFSLNFTVESAGRTKEVLDFYMHPTADAWKPGSYTNGHFQRGVV
ncbi:MAG: U32 family peptidase [bacterium]|nr:U32 family peptidase [bacterium]